MSAPVEHRAMTGKQLQAMLDKAGISQVKGAEALGLDARTVRRYVLGELPVPRVVALAIIHLAECKT